MNTPLGVQGAAHQARRDKQEAAFRKQYGLDDKSGIEQPIWKRKAVHQKIKQADERNSIIKRVNSILGSSGRSPSFA